MTHPGLTANLLDGTLLDGTGISIPDGATITIQGELVLSDSSGQELLRYEAASA